MIQRTLDGYKRNHTPSLHSPPPLLPLPSPPPPLPSRPPVILNNSQSINPDQEMEEALETDLADEERTRAFENAMEEALVKEAEPKRKHVDAEYEEEEEEGDKKRLKKASEDTTIPVENTFGDAEVFNIESLTPTPPPEEYWHPDQRDVSFCVYDIDYTESKSLNGGFAGKTMDLLQSNNIPVLRLYGVTKEAYSVTAMVRGFLPYIYVRACSSFKKMLHYDKKLYTPQILDQDPIIAKRIAEDPYQRNQCNLFKRNLNLTMKEKLSEWEKRKYPSESLVYSVELVRKENIDGYTDSLDWFLKITFCTPKLVVRARDILRSQYCWAGAKMSPPEDYQIFEANIPFALRFMVDVNLFGCSWVTVKKDRYIKWSNPETHDTFSDIEIVLNHADVIAHLPNDPQWGDAPPVRKMVFDIECAGRAGRFPVPYEKDEDDKIIRGSGDPVICIAVRITQEGKSDSERVIGDVIFTWGKCNQTRVGNLMCYYQTRGVNDPPLPRSLFEKERVGIAKSADGSHVYWAQEDEKNMLLQFRDFIVKIARPQFLSGYNITGFDMPYLIRRAESLGIDKEFGIIGLSKTDKSKVKPKIFSSKAFGSREVNEFSISGRPLIDAFTVILRDFKQRSYTLNASAEEHLKDKDGNPTERKADVPHDQIDPLWRGTNEHRRMVAEYCMKDVDIADKLEKKLIMFLDKSEMSRATGVPFSYILTRGQQIRVMSLLLRSAKKANLIVPTNEHKETVVEQEKYKGATVIEPKTGFYDECVFTLDFSALYPSIMRSKNMCLVKGTMVTLSNGLSVPIESMPENGGQLVLAGTSDGNLITSDQEKLLHQGQKPVIELLFLDGRKLRCTENHLIAIKSKKEGQSVEWIKAGNLILNESEIFVGPTGVPDIGLPDEAGFSLSLGPLGTLNMSDSRPKMLAFWRLIGYMCGDGSVCYREDTQSGLGANLSIGLKQDYERICDDLQLLGLSRPAMTERNGTGIRVGADHCYSCHLPQSFTAAMSTLSGIPVGRRSTQSATFPDVIVNPNCPVAVVREFLGGLFGANGHSPVLNKFTNQRAQLAGIGFTRHVQESQLEAGRAYMTELTKLLKKVGVTEEMYLSEHKSARGVKAAEYLKENPDSLVHTSVELRLVTNPGASFYEKIGFRYCAHKQTRLMAASSFWKYRSTMLDQARDIGSKAISIWNSGRREGDMRDDGKGGIRRAKSQYSQLKALNKAINEYTGEIFHPWVVDSLRRTAKCRGLLKRNFAILRHGSPGDPMDATEFLTQAGALEWFQSMQDDDLPKKISYAVSHDTIGLPMFTLPVISKKTCNFGAPVEVFDISVKDTHSFLAHGILVHNCYSTRILPHQRHLFREEDLFITPTETGDVIFVRFKIKKGLLPEILESLTSMRNAAKASLKTCPPFMKPIFDRRQNALKVTSNSVYGFTGAVVGQLPCPDIAKAVTSTGRIGIELTASMVENPYNEIPRKVNETDETYAIRCKVIRDEYPIEKGANETIEEHIARLKIIIEIIYGDTDSVMGRMKGVHDPAYAIEMGMKYAKWITKHFFDHPMEILFEKIYYPYLLVAKKRYAGLLWTKPDKWDKKDVKGMESVRRDNCLLTKRTIDDMMNTILKDRDVKKMIQIIVDRVDSVSKGTIDLSELVITKSLSKKPEDYYPVPPQAQVALKMRARNPHTAPQMGDRVPYIVTAYGGKKEKVSKKAEHPIEIINKNIPVDRNYYINNQLRKPCERILEPLKPGISSLIFSDFSKTIYLPASADAFSKTNSLPQLQHSIVKEAVTTTTPKKPTAVKGRKGIFNTRPNPPKVLPIVPGQFNIHGHQLVASQSDLTTKKEGSVELKIQRTINIGGLSHTSGTLAKYAKVAPECLVCSKPMMDYIGELSDAPAVCKHCNLANKAKDIEDYSAILAKTKKQCDSLWDTCVKCQKVEAVENLRECGTWECPNFFKRTTAKQNFNKIQQKWQRFDTHIRMRQ